jgi:hypothetical protein
MWCLHHHTQNKSTSHILSQTEEHHQMRELKQPATLTHDRRKSMEVKSMLNKLKPGKLGLIKFGFYLAAMLLPFFQPLFALPVVLGAGLFLSVQSWRTFGRISVSFMALILGSAAYGAAYFAIAAYLVPYAHELSIASWRWFPVWGAALLALAGSSLLIFLSRRRQSSQSENGVAHSGVPAVGLTLLWLVSIAAGGAGWFTNNHQATYDWQVMVSLNPELLSALPESDPDRVRILPQVTALDFAQNSNADNRTTTRKPIIAPCPDGSGKQCWQSSFHLRGLDDNIIYNVTGDIVMDVVSQPVDAVEMATNTQPRGAFFLLGPDSWPIKAAFAAHNPFSKPERAIYFRKSDGSWVYLIPYTSYRPTMLGAMVPYQPGVLEVTSWGLIWDHSVDSAVRNFPNVPFFPTTLERWYAEKYADWRGGITGRALTKKDHLEISEADSEGDKHWNPAPYLQYFKSIGQQAVIGLEPRGSDSSSLRELLFFDGATGALKVYRVPHGKVLNGPREATGMIRKLDWEAALKSKKVEPKFLVKGGNLFYLIGLVSEDDLGKDTADHPYNESVIIDADSMDQGKVVYHGRDVKDFLEGTNDALAPLKGTK